jgi:hypothetical protein
VTDVDIVLQRGKAWPPPTEVGRLSLYQRNLNLFDGAHIRVYNGLLRLFHSSAAEHQKIVTVLNWPRRLSLLWADLLIGETPDVLVSPADQPGIDRLLIDAGFWPELYKAIIDMSRFGVGAIKLLRDEEGKVQVQAIAPSSWFPYPGRAGEGHGPPPGLDGAHRRL